MVLLCQLSSLGLRCHACLYIDWTKFHNGNKNSNLVLSKCSILINFLPLQPLFDIKGLQNVDGDMSQAVTSLVE